MSIQLFGNINRNYQTSTINLFDKAKKQNNTPTLFNNTNSQKNPSSVTINISKESLDALHGTKLSGSIDLNQQLNDLKYISEHQPVENFENHFTNILSNDETSTTIQEKGSLLLNEYKNLYNEISKDYADGTRVRFIEDNTSKDGYKKITKEDELSILQNEFEKFINRHFGNHQKENYVKIAEITNNIQSTRARLNNSNFVPYEAKNIPDNFAEKLINSAKEYAKNYTSK